MGLPIPIPQQSIGMPITVDSGGYNMTGLSASAVFLNEAPGSHPVIVPLTIASDGLTGAYSTVGGEFNAAGAGPGNYDVCLKVYNGSSVLLYSLNFIRYVVVYPTLG